MRHLITSTILFSLTLFSATTILAQSPTPPTPGIPSAVGLTEPAIKLVDVIVSAIVALIIAIGGWLLQARRQREEHERFAKEMELRWAEFRAQHVPPARRVLDWLSDFKALIGEELAEDLEGSGPYVVGPPILDPRDFYGRQDLVARFFEVVLGRQMASISVMGARRSGKTSFLCYVSHPDILHARPKRHRYLIVPVYLNLQARVTDPESFYGYLVGATTRALEHRREACSIAPDLPTEIGYSFVEEFFDSACQYGWRFVLLLDEFEELTEGDVFDEDFFDSLRALATGRNVAWVTTSFRDLYQLGRQVDERTSPFYNIFYPEPIYLGALSEAEATQLITEPAAKAGHPFTDENVAFVLTLAGRLPFALQVAASMLYRAHRDGQTGLAAQVGARKTFNAAMQKHFAYYWRHFTPIEQQALQRLAQTIELTHQDLKALSDLTNYGFVEETAEDLRIASAAFADWVREARAQEG